MTREQWQVLCTELQGKLQSLCNHEISMWDCYEEIKREIKPLEFDD